MDGRDLHKNNKKLKMKQKLTLKKTVNIFIIFKREIFNEAENISGLENILNFNETFYK